METLWQQFDSIVGKEILKRSHKKPEWRSKEKELSTPAQSELKLVLLKNTLQYFEQMKGF